MGGCLRVWEFWGVRATLGSGSYSRDWYLFGKVGRSTFVNTYTTYRIIYICPIGIGSNLLPNYIDVFE
jgi:hypothetical protein